MACPTRNTSYVMLDRDALSIGPGWVRNCVLGHNVPSLVEFEHTDAKMLLPPKLEFEAKM